LHSQTSLFARLLNKCCRFTGVITWPLSRYEIVHRGVISTRTCRRVASHQKVRWRRHSASPCARRANRHTSSNLSGSIGCAWPRWQTHGAANGHCSATRRHRRALTPGATPGTRCTDVTRSGPDAPSDQCCKTPVQPAID